ncbi:DNA polymerase III subunit delta' C-terminal domain-containing protein [Legionella rowbothamii]|uniref:DNA polymerase III subunit delta' C-terminal domain-containing protein n=1 Tax=Legionella rowbothamii TaxID=96229 RepID=UPI001055E706|nr:DNA polymerase III subunit delta' [Legionella rowbothamii]
MSIYQSQWDHLRLAWEQGRNPQSMLFVGAMDRALAEFTTQFTMLVLCKVSSANPCRKCIDCQMVAQGEHPDVQWIKPEKIGGPIKIDQIRELQSYSYLTPQRAAHRLIIIEAADRMNIAAANALLKVLEEPATHTLFLLMAQQLSTVLPTVLSRCQVFHFTPVMDLAATNLLTLGERYSQESEQALIIHQAESILDGLIAVIEKKSHPCVVVPQWAEFELNTILWFLYLVYAQIQNMWINQPILTGPAVQQLQKLSNLLNPLVIFSQIDKINLLRRKLSHNLNVNSTLVLEDLLLDL